MIRCLEKRQSPRAAIGGFLFFMQMAFKQAVEPVKGCPSLEYLTPLKEEAKSDPLTV